MSNYTTGFTLKWKQTEYSVRMAKNDSSLLEEEVYASIHEWGKLNNQLPYDTIKRTYERLILTVDFKLFLVQGKCITPNDRPAHFHLLFTAGVVLKYHNPTLGEIAFQ